MKLSTATLNDTQHEWLKRFAAAVEKDSGGRIKAEIYPASQLGAIPRQIEGVQFASIQGWTMLPVLSQRLRTIFFMVINWLLSRLDHRVPNFDIFHGVHPSVKAILNRECEPCGCCCARCQSTKRRHWRPRPLTGN